MKDNCPTCGNEYKQLGNHWQFNDDHRPDIPSRSMEIIRGNLLGDGCIARRDGNPHFILEMSERDYIYWVKENLPNWLVSSVVEKDVSTDWGDVTVWRLSTRRHPDLTSLADWYGEKGKRFPKNIELTPLELTCWYLGDGGMKYPDKSYRCISIASVNEMQDWGAVDNIFDNLGVEAKKNGKNIYFTKNDSDILWEYMSNEPDGFDYKFPNNE